MAQTSKTLIVISFGLGGFLLIAGVALYLVAPSLAAASADPEMVQATVGGAGIAATLAGLASLVAAFKLKTKK